MSDDRGTPVPITQQPNLNFHLELLEEWNEEHVFLPITSLHLSTDRGVMVIQEVQVSYREMDWEWNEQEEREVRVVKGLIPKEVIQLCAVYGDEDSLAKLVVFENRAPIHGEYPTPIHGYTIPGVTILVDHTIRA
jgi:hypothetical protein